MKDAYSGANILAHGASLVNVDRICFVNQEPLQFFYGRYSYAGPLGAPKGTARYKSEQ
jgi:hypothetical protein